MSSSQAYNGTEPYIFVSYSHKDSNTVRPIIARMQADGYRVWFDEGIPGGDRYDCTIAEQIRGCGYFITLLSQNYPDSNYCTTELLYAIRQKKHILPIYLEDVTLPPDMDMHLSSLQWIAKYLLRDEDKFYQALYRSGGIEAFRTEPQGKKAPTEIKILTLPDGSTYTGEVNAKNEPHGHGTFRFADGAVYEGELKDGFPNGHGTFRSSDGVYEGEYKDGNHHGHGIFRYANGDVYDGEFKNDIRHGHGTFRTTDGNIYRGEFKNDQPNGRGTLHAADGTGFDAEFQNGKMVKIIRRFEKEPPMPDTHTHRKDAPARIRTISYMFDYTFTGEVNADGKPHGQGVMRHADLVVYEGQFRDGKYHGHGIFRWESGEVYEGEFENGASHGRGVLRYPDGKVYEGQFRGGDPSGHGILRHPDGSVLEGEFQYGMANGHGVLRYPDGRVCEGEYKNGVPVK